MDSQPSLPLKIHPEVLKMEASKKKLKSQMCSLPGCFEKNHKTSSSKKCVYNDCDSDDKITEKVLAYLRKQYPDYYGEEDILSCVCIILFVFFCFYILLFLFCFEQVLFKNLYFYEITITYVHMYIL